jgi:hypothetical protein
MPAQAKTFSNASPIKVRPAKARLFELFHHPFNNFKLALVLKI